MYFYVYRMSYDCDHLQRCATCSCRQITPQN